MEELAVATIQYACRRSASPGSQTSRHSLHCGMTATCSALTAVTLRPRGRLGGDRGVRRCRAGRGGRAWTGAHRVRPGRVNLPYSTGRGRRWPHTPRPPVGAFAFGAWGLQRRGMVIPAERIRLGRRQRTPWMFSALWHRPACVTRAFSSTRAGASAISASFPPVTHVQERSVASSSGYRARAANPGLWVSHAACAAKTSKEGAASFHRFTVLETPALPTELRP
jgi:hypothetical protein